MTRFGWTLLAIFAVVIAGFLALTRFGGLVPVAAPAPPVVAGEGVLRVPVSGVAQASIRDNWGDPREGGTRAHHGTDIAAAAGTPVLAVAPGRVEKLFQSARGGTTLYQRSADGRWIYYYAHLAGYAPGIREGMHVASGDQLGFVGDTGDAGPGNYHLHFGLQRMRSGQRWWEGEDVNPYPMLAGTAAAR